MPHGVAEVDADALVRPDFVDLTRRRRPRELQHAAAAAVRGRDEQQVIVPPDRRGDVDALVRRVRPAPFERAGVGIEARDLAVGEHDELGTAVEIDQDRRRIAVLEVLRLPRGLARSRRRARRRRGPCRRRW